MRRVGITTVALILAVVSGVGCAKSELDNNDINAMKKQYSRDAYDKAMIAQGKGAEVEKQHQEDAQRRSEPR